MTSESGDGVQDAVARGWNLYRIARLVNDLQTVLSGNPRRVARRAKNKLVGRALGRAGFWRRLWR